MREKLQGYGTAVNPILPRRARKRARQPPLHVLEILGAHDVVPIEQGPRLVARLAITFLPSLRAYFVSARSFSASASSAAAQAQTIVRPDEPATMPIDLSRSSSVVDRNLAARLTP